MRFELKEDSKAAEIKFVKDICAKLKGTPYYLSELFTEDFTRWVCTQIKDDIFPDVFEFFAPRSELKNACQSEDQINELIKENEDLKRRLDISEEDNETLRTKVNNLMQDQENELESARGMYNRTIESMKNKHDLDLLKVKARYLDLIMTTPLTGCCSVNSTDGRER